MPPRHLQISGISCKAGVPPGVPLCCDGQGGGRESATSSSSRSPHRIWTAASALVIAAADRNALIFVSISSGSFSSVTTTAVRHTFERSPGDDKTLLLLTRHHGGEHWGHCDLIHGHRAPEFVWPYVRDWILQRS
jgi:hypothetical protein